MLPVAGVCGAIALGHEHGERPAQDLFGLVAKNRLGAFVPEEDVAVAVGGDDRLVSPRPQEARRAADGQGSCCRVIGDAEEMTGPATAC